MRPLSKKQKQINKKYLFLESLGSLWPDFRSVPLSPKYIYPYMHPNEFIAWSPPGEGPEAKASLTSWLFCL
jgi:hypothetical protein